MKCWHCDCELELNFDNSESLKYYYCSVCDKWYEMRKERVKVNGAVPIKFSELANRPLLRVAA